MKKKKEFEELNEVSGIILAILYLAHKCNFQEGKLKEEEIQLMVNHIMIHQVDIDFILRRIFTHNDTKPALNFLHNSLNKN